MDLNANMRISAPEMQHARLSASTIEEGSSNRTMWFDL